MKEHNVVVLSLEGLEGLVEPFETSLNMVALNKFKGKSQI